MLILLITSFFLLLAIGAPIFVTIGLSSLLTIFVGGDIPPLLTITRMFGGLEPFAIMALPFFIFAANIMEVGGLSEKIVDWAYVLIGWITGGLAVATEVASMLFGALSGSAPATVVAMGRIMGPRLYKEGYPKSFVAGLLTSSGSVALIIPPSITMMLFAAATGASTGSLFIGGIIPGIIFGLGTAIYCYFYAKKHGIKGDKFQGFRAFVKATKDAAWALGVPVIILGGIYAGITTPTEAAGLSAIYALFVSVLVYKKVDWQGFWEICTNSAVTTAQVLILISTASVMAWLLATAQVPQMLSGSALLSSSTWMFLLVVNIVLLIGGMLVDPNSLIVIFGPIFYQVGTILGLSPTHLGIVITINLAIGCFTPPFGLNLFVANTIIDTPIEKIYRSVIPFLIISLIVLFLITYVPDITLWLPRLVFKGSM